jgi:hypothetical protein
MFDNGIAFVEIVEKDGLDFTEAFNYKNLICTVLMENSK